MKEIYAIARKIADVGGRLYLVGGAVRDAYMGRAATDSDYCVTGIRAETFRELFPDAFVAGAAFAVFRMTVDDVVTEFALARMERKVGQGHKGFEVVSTPEVTIEQDLYRRDLTVNAMAVDVLTEEMFDPYGGRQDIDQGVIRAVSAAFSEDPLRVYRAARFAAQLNFTIADDTLLMMRKLRAELTSLSPERVFVELKRALASDKPSLFFRWLHRAGVLDVHFKEVAALAGVEQPVKWHPEGDAFEHTMQVLDAAAALTTRAEVRFAALVHDVGKARTPRHKWPAHHGHEVAGVPLVKHLCARLRLPTHWTQAALFATEQHMKIHVLDKMKCTKVVDLLTDAHRTPLGVDGFSIIGMADDRGRNNPNAYSPNAESMPDYWRVIQSVSGKSLNTDATGKEFGEALREARATALHQARKGGLP
ncbi:HD domain-containing protein [Alicyclobacillus suci]|uniref:HD domain-containing protein n=1 Tax=Alicyclobacillus suci TaxID=2816080 RepID=UPI001A8FB2B1|nr:HD domain-containing protein [Alicyclobacillus suci]